MHSLLIIGKVWPESTTTGAGVRMMQLIHSFKNSGYTITFASTAQKSDHSEDLTKLGVETVIIELNSDSFNVFLRQLQPAIVMFDRFTTEEQFGWRVEEELPDSIRILDTEDLHFLRSAREIVFKKVGFPYSLDQTLEEVFKLDITYREIAALLRCDVNLIISEFELHLLKEHFPVPESQLYYLPLLPTGDYMKLDFSQRKDFIFAGNFLHHPNKDAVCYLTTLWPSIKQLIPDATLRIYGAYADESLRQLHNPTKGFHVLGWVENLSTVLEQSRVLIAPLRFGAGLKSKILESFGAGTPVATTPIGAEGIGHITDFGGVIGVCDSQWIDQLAQLYCSEEQWTITQTKGLQIISSRFQGEELKELPTWLNQIVFNPNEHRKHLFLQKLLQHETLKSTKYLSKWIMEKNKV